MTGSINIRREKVRAYLYRVMLATAPIATAYGVIAENKVGLWIAFGTAILGNGLATINTSRE